jgi:hypothetical protein
MKIGTLVSVGVLGAMIHSGIMASMEVPERQEHVFYRGTDGAINHILWDAASNKLGFDQWTKRIGAPLVAVRRLTAEQAAALFTPPAIYYGVTGVAEFEGSRCVLSFKDPLNVETVRVEGHTYPLAANYTASMAMLLAQEKPQKLGLARLLRPQEYAATFRVAGSSGAAGSTPDAADPGGNLTVSTRSSVVVSEARSSCTQIISASGNESGIEFWSSVSAAERSRLRRRAAGTRCRRDSGSRLNSLASSVRTKADARAASSTAVKQRWAKWLCLIERGLNQAYPLVVAGAASQCLLSPPPNGPR